MMTIDMSGQNILLEAGFITIKVEKTHPLLQLANALPWQMLMDLVSRDLKDTTKKGFWWTGRKIKVRLHLAAYFLQRIYDLTDRKLEYQIKDNAAFQLFCGINIVNGWHVIDHTKIEEFRSRLSPETQRTLANSITKAAVKLGFGDPREVDIDSTVQEACMAYPSDASLMTRIAGIGSKLINFVNDNMLPHFPESIGINIKAIKEKAREYFFLSKNKAIEIKREVFKDFHKLVKQQIRPVVKLCEALTEHQVANLPWNIRRSYESIINDAWRYLLDVGHFTRTHTIKVGKLLSFHAKAVACIKKGKIGKEFEFGRVFQLGRIKGNFLFVIESTSIEMNDKLSFIPLLMEHSKLFGDQIIGTIATDKGYWSTKNHQKLLELQVHGEGLQRPSKVKVNPNNLHLEEHLRNRRAGIEPLIGHAKKGGQLGKSRMKSDSATLAAGYGSVLGLNLRQMIRHQQGKLKKLA